MKGKSRDAKKNATGVSKKRAPAPPPLRGADVPISVEVDRDGAGAHVLGADRLTFDGYKLTWHGSDGKSYTGFSGPANESSKESEKDVGPTPQGKYAVDPANIEELQPSPDWGEHRVRLEPYKETVQRMTDCFKVVRTGMYIHGGSETGSHGCIELNNDSDEKDFFARLKKYGKKIELEVKYSGDREKKYEEASCPY
jgi:hypothetical protein